MIGTKPNSNYNGFIYERIVDPMIAGMHSYIAKKVANGTTVVECKRSKDMICNLI